MTIVHADPYWKWSEATNYAHTRAGEQSGKQWVQILVELVMPTDQADQADQAAALHNYLQKGSHKGFVPEPYRKPGTRYCTAWVARDGIAHLPPEIVERFKLGLAANDPDKSKNTFSESIEESWGAGAKNGRAVSPCVLAVIDDYVNCAHSTFATTGGNSRIKLVWDQAGNTSTVSKTPNYGYGKLLKDLRPWSFANNKIRASHGTHVAGLVGGAVTPGFRMRNSSPHLFANASKTDAASKAPMAVVMLPNSTVADTSGGALGVNVLDALTFLLGNIDAETHLLVNLSFGTMSGAHDGSGVLECAIQDLIDKRPGKLTVVLPSGNSFESQCHAQFSLEADAPYSLTWRVLPDDKTCSFLELWLPSDANVSVGLQSPDGTQALVLDDEVDHVVLPSGGVAIAGLWRDPPAKASGKKRVLIAMAPTRAAKGTPCAPHGDWTVKVTNLDTKPIALIQAWVERDNASFGQRTRGRQSYLVDKDSLRKPSPLAPAATGVVTGFGSLNSIGTFAGATVVSGYNLKTRTVANYSGAGANGAGGVRAPSQASPSEESWMLKGIPGIGNQANSVVRLGGTSVAAPYAARLIFNDITAGSTGESRSAVGAALDPRTGVGLIGP